MRTNLSFGERVLNVWAAIVRVLFPRYCVKYLTLKSRKNAAKYLPGAEEERKLIDKLELSSKEIAARVWSYDTKLALLKCKNFALIDEIKTEQEFDIVISVGSVGMVASAMRVYTPSRAKMMKIVSSFLSMEYLCILAKQVPTAFDTLKPWEILGVAENEEARSDRKEWQLALALARTKSAWAPLFLIELRKIVPRWLGGEGLKLMDDFFDIAFAAKKDVSEMMPYFCVLQKEKYVKIRENYMEYKCFASYFRMMFPQLVKYLRKDMYRSIHNINLRGELTMEEDAYAWLRIGYERMGEQDIYSCLIANMQQIKENVSPVLYNQLFKRMVEKAPAYPALATLYRLADNVMATEIPVKLVSGMKEKQPGATLRFAFPFNGWNVKLAIRAIEAMVANNDFPAERLGELSDDLKEVAVAAMEEQSQIAVIKGGNIAELIAETQLLPKAEIEFLKLPHAWKPAKFTYIEKYQLTENSFRFLVYTIVMNLDERVELISRYADKWGLTESQYCMIMQSKFVSSAPFLKKYVRK